MVISQSDAGEGIGSGVTVPYSSQLSAFDDVVRGELPRAVVGPIDTFIVGDVVGPSNPYLIDSATSSSPS
jgi:hypothetical protein